jgi:uncharacterized protein (TIGR02246 family)
MKALIPCLILLCGMWTSALAAEREPPGEIAIRKILDQEVVTWNRGDADAYSRHFAQDGTFTNVQGMFFTGHKAFRDRHAEIFGGQFRGTKLQLEVVSLRFVTPTVAAVDALTWVSNFQPSGPPPGLHPDEKGRLRTRLFQLFVKHGNEWQVEVYHNVDIKPSIPSPQPR